MMFLVIVLTVVLGIAMFCQAFKHSFEQWYYGRLNRRTFERWRKERR